MPEERTSTNATDEVPSEAGIREWLAEAGDAYRSDMVQHLHGGKVDAIWPARCLASVDHIEILLDEIDRLHGALASAYIDLTAGVPPQLVADAIKKLPQVGPE